MNKNRLLVACIKLGAGLTCGLIGASALLSCLHNDLAPETLAAGAGLSISAAILLKQAYEDAREINEES